MAKKSGGSGFAWFIAGVTMGVAAAVLLAPQSGKETLESLSKAAAKGREYGDRKRREAAETGRKAYAQSKDKAGETVESGKNILEQGLKFAEEAKGAGKEVLEQGKKFAESLTSKEGKEKSS